MTTNVWTTVSALNAGDTCVFPQHPGKTWEILSGGEPVYPVPDGARPCSCLETGELTYAVPGQACIKLSLKAVPA